MKRTIKRALKGIWRWTFPVRRPFAAKLENFLSRCLSNALRAQEPAPTSGGDVDLALDGVIGELYRLQTQVEILQRTIEDRENARERPSDARLAG